MIKEIEIEGYESHLKSKVTLVPGITIVTGESDVGKSSLKRAAEWVACNRPLGDEFINWDLNQTEVKLDQVTKTRTRKHHTYVLNGETYKAFKSDVPSRVQEYLGLSPINFQDQHKPYFLLADSPGQVARTLNEVTDLTLVDRALKEGKRRIKRNKGKSELLFEQVQGKRKEIKDLDWVEQAVIDLDSLERKKEELIALSAEVSQLSNELDKISETKERIKKYKQVPAELEILEVLMKQLGITEKDLEEVDIKITEVRKTQSDIKNFPPQIDEVDQLDLIVAALAKVETELEIGQLIDTVKKSQIKVTQLQGVKRDCVMCKKITEEMSDNFLESEALAVSISDVEMKHSKYSQAQKVFYKEEKEFHREFKALGICPLCEREL